MPTIDRSLATGAVVDLLRGQMDPTPVGDGSAPEAANAPDGYLMVHSVPLSAAYAGHGFAGQPHSTQTLRYQITGVGARREQAEHLVSDAMAILVDRSSVPPRDFIHDLTIAGMSVMDRMMGGTANPQSDLARAAGEYFDLQVSASV